MNSTRRSRSVLLASLLCLALVPSRPALGAEPVDTLRANAIAAATAAEARDWPRAEAAYREAARVADERAAANPDNLDLPATRDGLLYNAACAAALGGRKDAAFETLEKLVATPWYDNARLLESDADLASLRLDAPRFAALVAAEHAVMARATEGHAVGKVLVPARGAAERVAGIVALHGGGANIEDIEPAWRRVADELGVIVILVRGSLVQDVGAFSYDQRDPSRDVARIEEWIERARSENPSCDASRLFLSGFSQGGGMAWLLAVRGERAWNGVVPIGAYVQVAVRERVKGEPVHPVSVVAMVGAQDEDAIREINRSLVAQDGVKALRAKLEVIDGAGHGLPADLPARMRRAMAWCEAR